MSKSQYIRPELRIIEMHDIMAGYPTPISKVATKDSRAPYFGADNDFPSDNAPWSEEENTTWE